MDWLLYVLLGLGAFAWYGHAREREADSGGDGDGPPAASFEDPFCEGPGCELPCCEHHPVSTPNPLDPVGLDPASWPLYSDYPLTRDLIS